MIRFSLSVNRKEERSCGEILISSPPPHKQSSVTTTWLGMMNISPVALISAELAGEEAEDIIEH